MMTTGPSVGSLPAYESSVPMLARKPIVVTPIRTSRIYPPQKRTSRRSIVHDPLCERLARARVRPIHHIHRLLRLDGAHAPTSRRPRALARALCAARGERRGAGQRRGAVRAQRDADAEVLRLDRERLLDDELVGRVVERHVEALEDERGDEHHFLPGERAALRGARGERLVRGARGREADVRCRRACRSRTAARRCAGTK